MIPTPTFRIESYTPDEAQLKAYALAFRDAHTRWQNYLGDAIFMSDGGFEEDAEDLREAIAKARTSRLVALLKKYEALPEKLYRITNIASGKSASLPIYTDIPEISLEGRGSVLAKASPARSHRPPDLALRSRICATTRHRSALPHRLQQPLRLPGQRTQR